MISLWKIKPKQNITSLNNTFLSETNKKRPSNRPGLYEHWHDKHLILFNSSMNAPLPYEQAHSRLEQLADGFDQNDPVSRDVGT